MAPRATMMQRGLGRFLRMAAHVGLGAFGVAAITAVCFPLHPDLAIPAFLYLLLVVLQSAVAEFAASAIVSVIAVATLDYFFVPPILAWDINRPLDCMALATYLATSLVITRFAAQARSAARNSESKRKALALLYEAACQLLSLEPEAAAGERFFANLAPDFRASSRVPVRCQRREGAVGRRFGMRIGGTHTARVPGTA